MRIESDFQRQVISYLKQKRVWFFRFQAQSNLNGLPDIICLYKGFFIGLELKADKGNPTELQLMKIKTINENGGIGVITNDLSEIKGIFNKIDRGDTNE